MKSQNSDKNLHRKRRFAVILCRPENSENIGLVARNMKNTGFENLRLVGVSKLEKKTFVTAVHAQEILKTARFSQDLTGAIHDLDVIFASTAKPRKNFSVLPMEEAIKQIFGFPSSTKIGLLFGNERTGLTSEDLLQSNFRFKIPQAGRQPSYNLASAVLITLFSIFSVQASDEPDVLTQPISRDEQEVCVQRILINLEKKGFIHKTNKKHMEEMVWDLFGRLTMTAEDRSLLLALFSKGTLKKM